MSKLEANSSFGEHGLTVWLVTACIAFIGFICAENYRIALRDVRATQLATQNELYSKSKNLLEIKSLVRAAQKQGFLANNPDMLNIWTILCFESREDLIPAFVSNNVPLKDKRSQAPIVVPIATSGISRETEVKIVILVGIRHHDQKFIEGTTYEPRLEAYVCSIGGRTLRLDGIFTETTADDVTLELQWDGSWKPSSEPDTEYRGAFTIPFSIITNPVGGY